MKNQNRVGDVGEAVYWGIRRAVDDAVYEAVCRDVSDAAWWTVNWAVSWAVQDPRHPALADFLEEVL